MTEKVLNEIVDRLFPIRETLIEREENGWDNNILFDYPDYGGLPKRISYKLSPEAVDAMQQILYNKYSRKRDFKKAYEEELFYLGEKIKKSTKKSISLPNAAKGDKN